MKGVSRIDNHFMNLSKMTLLLLSVGKKAENMLID